MTGWEIAGYIICYMVLAGMIALCIAAAIDTD